MEILSYIASNTKSELANMATYHLRSHNWRVFTPRELVQFNNRGEL